MVVMALERGGGWGWGWGLPVGLEAGCGLETMQSNLDWTVHSLAGPGRAEAACARHQSVESSH
jgi:hypothetical protein